MGFVGNFGWINNSSGKRQSKRLLWSLRAALKRAMRAVKREKHQVFRFQYDPQSYALNFDDGEVLGRETQFREFLGCPPEKAICVYVVWVEKPWELEKVYRLVEGAVCNFDEIEYFSIVV